MKIDFVVPRVSAEQFSGGLWCLFQYADGLAAMGHEVRVIPIVPSPEPKWFGGHRFIFHGDGSSGLRSVRSFLSDLLTSSRRAPVVRSTLNRVLLRLLKYCTFEVGRGVVLSHLRRSLSGSGADVTIGSHFETALAVRLFGSGDLFYFGQHYEPLFASDLRGGEISVLEARASYHLGLRLIANSTWLLDQLVALEGVSRESISLSLNAVNHEYFYPAVGESEGNDDYVRVISYDGNGLTWKGFTAMALAMSAVRQARPHVKIEWKVYGRGIDPVDVTGSEYVSLGFLSPEQLGAAYRDCDILLSASWYESFPLFPLEAMACGLAVVTSQFGTEDYAVDGINCLIVDPHSVDSIAAALTRLIDDRVLRVALSNQATVDAQEFTWQRSVSTMERILTRR